MFVLLLTRLVIKTQVAGPPTFSTVSASLGSSAEYCLNTASEEILHLAFLAGSFDGLLLHNTVLSSHRLCVCVCEREREERKRKNMGEGDADLVLSTVLHWCWLSDFSEERNVAFAGQRISSSTDMPHLLVTWSILPEQPLYPCIVRADSKTSAHKITSVSTLA